MVWVGSLLCFFFGDVVYGVVDGFDFVYFFVRDIDFEFVFKCYDEFDNVEGVCIKIVSEVCFYCYFFWFYVEFFDCDFFYVFKNVVRYRYIMIL